jgi:hypothetical protein
MMIRPSPIAWLLTVSVALQDVLTHPPQSRSLNLVHPVPKWHSVWKT